MTQSKMGFYDVIGIKLVNLFSRHLIFNSIINITDIPADIENQSEKRMQNSPINEDAALFAISDKNVNISLSNWTLYMLILAATIQVYTIKSICVESTPYTCDIRFLYYTVEFTVLLASVCFMLKIYSGLYIEQSVLDQTNSVIMVTDDVYSLVVPVKGYKHVGSQTENRDYVKEADILKVRCEREKRKIARERRILKRKFIEKMSTLKKEVSGQAEELSRLQMKIPQLEKDNLELTAEKEAIEKQLSEERNHGADLLTKFHRLHGQLVHMGSRNIQS